MNPFQPDLINLDIDPIVQLPDGYKRCSVCKNVYPLRKPNFHFRVNYGWSHRCSYCVTERDLVYKNTERGYMVNLFNDCLKRQRRPKMKEMTHTLKTKESFLAHWESQKRQHGWRCVYSGNIMTMIKGLNKASKCPTNLSVDRIHPAMGYTETNVVFCCWYFNDAKNFMSPKMCKKVVEYCEEKRRYDLL